MVNKYSFLLVLIFVTLRKFLNEPPKRTKVICKVKTISGLSTHELANILECEVKWALGSITTNKASGGDGIPAELFQILKDDAVKVLYSICQQIWKAQRDHKTGKGQFSLQSQRKAMQKNVQTTAQLHSSHMLVK